MENAEKRRKLAELFRPLSAETLRMLLLDICTEDNDAVRRFFETRAAQLSPDTAAQSSMDIPVSEGQGY